MTSYLYYLKSETRAVAETEGENPPRFYRPPSVMINSRRVLFHHSSAFLPFSQIMLKQVLDISFPLYIFYYIFWNTRTIKQLYPRCHDPIPKLAITKVHFNIGRSQPTDYISVFFLNQLAEPLTQNCDLMVMLWYPDCLTDAQLIKMQFKRGTNCAKFHGAEIRAFLSCAQGQLYSQFRNAVKPVFFSASRNPAVTYLLPPGLTLVHGTRSLPVVHSAARSHTTWLCSLLSSPVQCPVFSESSLRSKS